MKNVYLDVRLELDELVLSMQKDPTAYIVETARGEADRLCDESGAKLHTDSPPEFYISKGTHRLTGQRVVLVATRWQVTAPESAPMGPPGR